MNIIKNLIESFKNINDGIDSVTRDDGTIRYPVDVPNNLDAFGGAGQEIITEKNTNVMDGLKERRVDTNNNIITTDVQGQRLEGISEYYRAKELEKYQADLVSELPEQVWQENLLNNFDTPTYHLTLFVATKTAIQEDQYKKLGTIVAETGSTTRFHIDNLEVASPVGGSEKVSTVAPKITFQLTEPNGAGFFPAAITATREMGIPQFIKAGFALEVRFKGRDKQTGQPSNIGGGVWVYKLIIQDIQTKHGVEGSTYFFTTHAISQVANQTEFSTVQEEITIGNVGTLGEAFNKLEKELNRYHRNIAISKGSSTEDTVKINFPSKWSKWKLLVSTGNESTDKQKLMNRVLESGTNVKSFMGTLIYFTKEFAELLKDAGAHIDSDNSFKVKDYLGKYYKIKTETEFKDTYDYGRQEYPKIITYNIIEILENIQVKESRLVEMLEDKKKQQAKCALLIREKLMNKRYDYLNTGLNTEVLQFDATIDAAHIIPEAIYDGTTSYPLNAPTKEEPVSRSDALNPNASFQTLLKAESQAMEQVAEIRREISEKETALNSDSFAGNEISAGKEIADLRKKEQDAVEFRDEITARRQARVSQDFTTAEYLGDIVTSTENLVRERFLPKKTKRNDPNDLSMMLTLQRAKQDATYHLLNIEVGIKGDPYWLGEPSFYEDTGGAGAQLTEESTFPYDTGPPFFLFSMFFPTNYDGNGQSRPLFNALYSGVYQAMTVIHTMRNGQYNIFITAIRDTTIQEEVVKQMVENLKFELPDSEDKPTIDEKDGKDNDQASDGARDLGTGEPVSEDLYERQKRAVDVLMEEGLSRDQAIGMVANLTAESALRTDAINRNDGGPGKHSEGLAQWNRTRLDNLKNFAGVPINTPTEDIPFDTQLRYIAHEFKGSGGNGAGSESLAWGKMESANNLQEATIAGNYYERFKDYTDPPSSTNEVGHRIKIANELTNRLNNEQDPNNTGIG